MIRKIGLLGGTFNPLHQGHLVIAQDALEHFELEQVWFLPSGLPPHKHAADLAPAEHRIAMIEGAIEGDPRFALCRMDVDRAGPCYTVDTLGRLQEEYPATDWHFIIGADTLTELHTWKDIGRALTLCRFVTMNRPGIGLDAPGIPGLPPPWADRLRADLFTGHQVDISSTEIRMRVAEGLGIKYLVPDAVEMYIHEHNLYRQ